MALSLNSLSSVLARETAPLAAAAAAAASPSPRLALPPRAARAATVRAVTSPAASSSAGKREPRGIMKPRPVSPEMQALVGDPENKKVIMCDEKLKKIFAGKDRVGFLEIAGLISPHFL
ncbi:hypothetical protein EUGRSUZ_G01289 [Eucalyptus grandis]|uniref:Uncharacterized protein n=2 Tax=Eucalyptus grandis TaxID=71139 RepID=A0ACC3K2D3_EUCGR|nr:hypothetical protein EUGRSUZ_G01289 [Eucalyptus grandis]